MSSRKQQSVGYIGVDILNNATICNELTALTDHDVALDLVSVYQIAKPTFYRDDSVSQFAGEIFSLYPLSPPRLIFQLLLAPFFFGWRFPVAIWKALTGPVEGWSERFKVMAHLLPAVALACHWRRRGISHVHCQWAHTATTIGMHAAEMLGVGFSFMGHANDLFVHRVALEDKVRRARFILCISEFHRRFYMDLGADPQRLHVVYCGVSLGRFRGRQTFLSHNRRIVSIGRLVEKKGFDVLIRACAELRDRGEPFDCVIAGSGPEYGKLQALIEQLQLQDQVSVTGEAMLQEEMPDFLRCARFFVLPCVRDQTGDMDGLPQVLIESMACRIPAISTFLVGIPDLVRHNENGILVETRNVKATADAMLELLNDDQRTESLGKAAEVWARTHFGRDELARRLVQVFDWASQNPGHSVLPEPLAAAPGSEALYDYPEFYAGDERAAEPEHLVASHA